MKEIWKYLDVGRVKHYFELTADISAVCGVGSRWYSKGDFLENKSVLKRLPKCSRCVRIKKVRDAIRV